MDLFWLNLGLMELRHLRYFVALAEQLNFTAAAEKVHVTQSTLSHQIRQLEDELGRPLFERGARKVTMTLTGEAFLERARNALREVDEGIWTVRMAAEEMNGVVRVGTTHTFNMRIVPRCISMFLQTYPSVRVEVLEMSGNEIAAALVKGELDIGVTYKPQNTPGLHFESLYTEEMMLAVGAKHPFAKKAFSANVRTSSAENRTAAKHILDPGAFRRMLSHGERNACRGRRNERNRAND